MSSYTLDADADLDLQEITSFIAEQNPNAARQLAARLFAAFETLAQTPGIGHSRRDLTIEPVLFWSLDRYVVIYRETVLGIQIVAVSQGSRDLPRLIRRRVTSNPSAFRQTRG